LEEVSRLKKHASGWREDELTTFSTPHIPSYEPHYLISIYPACILPLTPRSCRKYTCPLATEGFTLGQHTKNNPWLQGIRIEGILPLGPRGNTIRKYHYKHGHTTMETIKTHSTINLTFTSPDHPENLTSTPNNEVHRPHRQPSSLFLFRLSLGLSHLRNPLRWQNPHRR
jgi:hypothetical protein